MVLQQVTTQAPQHSLRALCACCLQHCCYVTEAQGVPSAAVSAKCPDACSAKSHRCEQSQARLFPCCTASSCLEWQRLSPLQLCPAHCPAVQVQTLTGVIAVSSKAVCIVCCTASFCPEWQRISPLQLCPAKCSAVQVQTLIGVIAVSSKAVCMFCCTASVCPECQRLSPLQLCPAKCSVVCSARYYRCECSLEQGCLHKALNRKWLLGVTTSFFQCSCTCIMPCFLRCSCSCILPCCMQCKLSQG